MRICGTCGALPASSALQALLLQRVSLCSWVAWWHGVTATSASVRVRRDFTLPVLLGLLPPEVCMEPEGTESAG